MKLPEKYYDFVKSFLSDLIRLNPTTGNENRVISYLSDSLFIQNHNSFILPTHVSSRKIINNSHIISNIKQKKTCGNLILELPSVKAYENTTLLVTHADVVPIFTTAEVVHNKDKNILYGRGACDALGQISVIFLLLKMIKEEKINLRRKLIIAIVSSEEYGGWGIISVLKKIEKECNFAIVMEPTDNKICTACRGAIWFMLSVTSGSSHMGDVTKYYNTWDFIYDFYNFTKGFEKKCASISKSKEFFPPEKYNIMNIGKITSKGMPSIKLSNLEIFGSLGYSCFNSDLEIWQLFETELQNYFRKKADIKIICTPIHLSNQPYFLKKHEIKEANRLGEILRTYGKESKPHTFTASCDANLIYDLKKIPTIVFGPGTIIDAHSDMEKIKLDDIFMCAKYLIDFFRE